MDMPTAPNNAPGTKTPPPKPALGLPSKSRREALKSRNETTPIPLSNLTPLPKYYSAASKVLLQFKHHLSQRELDDAYIIGRRFAYFSTVSLPSHDYYKSDKYGRERVENHRDVVWVMGALERVVELMDKEELAREEEKMRKLKEEEEKKQIEWEKGIKDRLLMEGDDSEECHNDGNDADGVLDIESKLAKLNALFPKDGEAIEVKNEQDLLDTQPNIQTASAEALPLPLPPPIAPPETTMSSSDLALFYSTDATQQLKSNGATPMFEDPPTYDLFLNTLKTPSQINDTIVQQPSSPKIPIRQQRITINNQFTSLLNYSNRIEIIPLSTYQGRLPGKYDSTNGCTVIAPLVVATHINPHHYTTHNKQYKLGISNTEISEIIDRRSPPILQIVRGKLGLGEHALIVPSDVHDYLVDESILPQEKFVGVCGGNVLDEEHGKVLIDLLVSGSDENDGDSRLRKVGAGELLVIDIVFHD